MTLVRWEPTRELSTLQHEMNRVFGNIFDLPASATVRARRQWIPAIDLVETPEKYVLHADLPGIAADDVTIEFDENVLTVSGERRAHGGVNSGQEPRVIGEPVQQRLVQRGQDQARPGLPVGLRSHRITGQRGALGRRGPLATHVADHHPPATPD